MNRQKNHWKAIWIYLLPGRWIAIYHWKHCHELKYDYNRDKLFISVVFHELFYFLLSCPKEMPVHHFGSSDFHHLENIQFTSFKMNQCINNNSPPSWFCYFEFSYFFQFGVANLKKSRIYSELVLKTEYSTALFWTQFLKNISRSGISIIPNTRLWKQSHHK